MATLAAHTQLCQDCKIHFFYTFFFIQKGKKIVIKSLNTD